MSSPLGQSGKTALQEVTGQVLPRYFRTALQVRKHNGRLHSCSLGGSRSGSRYTACPWVVVTAGAEASGATLEGSWGLGCVRMEMLSNTPREDTLFMMRALSLLLKMRPLCHACTCVSEPPELRSVVKQLVRSQRGAEAYQTEHGWVGQYAASSSQPAGTCWQNAGEAAWPDPGDSSLQAPSTAKPGLSSPVGATS